MTKEFDDLKKKKKQLKKIRVAGKIPGKTSAKTKRH